MIETKIVLLDIDGTLIEKDLPTKKGTLTPKELIFNSVLREYYSNDRIDFVTSIIAGLTDWLIAERALAKVQPGRVIEQHEWEQLLKEITKQFEVLPNQNAPDKYYYALPGAKLLLAELKVRCITLGIITGNLRCFAESKLRQANLLRFFSVGSYGNDGKTRMDILNNIKKHLDSEQVNNIVFIGDTLYDGQAASSIGMRFIGVGTSGLKEQEVNTYLHGCDKLWVRNLTELNKIKRFIGV